MTVTQCDYCGYTLTGRPHIDNVFALEFKDEKGSINITAHLTFCKDTDCRKSWTMLHTEYNMDGLT